MAVDASKIVHAVMEGSRIRDSKGIIPLFGVYLSFSFLDYYNLLSFDFEKTMIEKDRIEEAESLLIKAAQECGYTTFHGIRTSWEWEEIVKPMIENDRDCLEGFASVALAFGWGTMSIESFFPGKELVIRVGDSYEADGYMQLHGSASYGKCYMLRGVTAAFMDLLYGDDYPNGCFTFQAREHKCRAKGDPYCEFIAR